MGEGAGAAWKRVPLEAVATVAVGVTLGSEPGGDGTVELPYVRVANVLDGHIDIGGVERMRILRSPRERFTLQKGDLLLTEDGDLGKLGRGALWEAGSEPCLHQNHAFRVRCGDRMLSDFLALHRAAPAGRAYFRTVGKQTTDHASVNSTQVKAVPAPPVEIEEQERLLDPIRSVRKRTAAMDRQIAKARTIQQTVVEDLPGGHRTYDSAA